MLTERELDVLLRRARGESQTDIAHALGITQGAVSQFETNAQRKIIDAENMMKFLGDKLRVEQGRLEQRVVYRGGK